MLSITEKEKILNLKSYRILKWGIPILSIIILIEYFLLYHHSSISIDSTNLFFDLLYTILIFPLIILLFLIFTAIISLIIDLIEIWLIRNN